MRTAFVGFIAASNLIFASPIKMAVCPGEGPGPLALSDISSELPVPQAMPTEGSIKDFNIAEKKGALYYRNDREVVYEMDLNSQKNKFLTASGLPLSKMIDSRGRYLMTEKFHFLFDTFNTQLGWKYLGHLEENTSVTPLYWRRMLGNDVYFEVVNWRDKESAKQNLTVYSWSQGKWSSNTCDLKGIKGTVRLGEGHFFPNVFLYETQNAGENETTLRLWNIHINAPIFKCVPSLAYSYVHKIPGRVKSVSQFAGSKMFAVRTTDPERNLIWTNKSDNKGCRYFNFGERESFVMNHHNPAIAAWGPNDGFTLIYPNEQKRAQIFPGSQYFPLTQNDVWMNSNGNTLIGALQTPGKATKELYRVKLK